MSRRKRTDKRTFQPIWHLRSDGNANKIAYRIDLLCAVLSGVITASSQIRSEGADAWITAGEHPVVAPLLPAAAREAGSRLLFSAANIVVGAAFILLFAYPVIYLKLELAGFEGWRYLLIISVIFGTLGEARAAALEAVELTRARRLLLYAAGIAMVSVGIAASLILIELGRRLLFPDLSPNSDWLIIPLFVFAIILWVMQEALWDRWKPSGSGGGRNSSPAHPVKVQTAQSLAKTARFRALVGIGGHGSQTWPNGARYDGQMEHRQRQGHGVYTWASGTRYEGGWRKDKQHGLGVVIAADGTE